MALTNEKAPLEGNPAETKDKNGTVIGVHDTVTYFPEWGRIDGIDGCTVETITKEGARKGWMNIHHPSWAGTKTKNVPPSKVEKKIKS